MVDSIRSELAGFVKLSPDLFLSSVSGFLFSSPVAFSGSRPRCSLVELSRGFCTVEYSLDLSLFPSLGPVEGRLDSSPERSLIPNFLQNESIVMVSASTSSVSS